MACYDENKTNILRRYGVKILSGVLGLMLLPGVVWAGNYTDNGNGAVTDNVTGLMWQQQDDNTGRTWEEAIAHCEGFFLAGLGDWRLPNIKELESLTDDSRYNPAIDPVFANTIASDYWSSTTDALYTGSAWTVGFLDGYVGAYYKTGNLYARCVRGGQ